MTLTMEKPAALAALSGREQLEKLTRGEFPAPPFAATTSIRLTEVGEGRAVFTGMPAHAFLNPFGTIHGGWIATIIDSALSCAVHSMLKPGQVCTTTSMTVHYVRALKADSGEVRCEGVAVHSGNRTATSEARLIDSQGAWQRIVPCHGCWPIETKPPSECPAVSDQQRPT